MATENNVPWSTKNVILCNNLRDKKKGGNTDCQSGSTVHDILVKDPDYIVAQDVYPEDEQSVNVKCFEANSKNFLKENCRCLDGSTSSLHAQLRSRQWYFIGRQRDARTGEEVLQALESGPVWTCYGRHAELPVSGSWCYDGCNKVGLITRSNETQWFIEEYLEDGSSTILNVDKGSACEATILKKASYSEVYYDYDKANAYFIREDVPVNDIEFIDEGELNAKGFKNMGMAKMKCSLIGVKCKGVGKLSDSSIKLISTITASQSNSSSLIEFFRKIQMVLYLRSDKGQYITVRDHHKKLSLRMTSNREDASPFFITSSQFVLFDYPDYVVSPSKKGIVKRDPEQPNPLTYWYIIDTNLQNIQSELSLDVNTTTNTVFGNTFDPSSLTQRFDVYLSGLWQLYSNKLVKILHRVRNHEGPETPSYEFREYKSGNERQMLRWQGRQLVLQNGQHFLPDWSISEAGFKLSDTANRVRIKDGIIATRYLYGDNKYLSVSPQGAIVTTDKKDETKWTFEYGDI